MPHGDLDLTALVQIGVIVLILILIAVIVTSNPKGRK